MHRGGLQRGGGLHPCTLLLLHCPLLQSTVIYTMRNASSDHNKTERRAIPLKNASIRRRSIPQGIGTRDVDHLGEKEWNRTRQWKDTSPLSEIFWGHVSPTTQYVACDESEADRWQIRWRLSDDCASARMNSPILTLRRSTAMSKPRSVGDTPCLPYAPVIWNFSPYGAGDSKS